jgi:sugar lactone lactonase YvrE
MSGNRFDFLELSSASPASVQQAGKPAADITADPVDAEVPRRVDDEGRPLAQVVQTDMGGYRAFLDQIDPTDAFIGAVYVDDTREVSYELRAVEVFGGRGIKAGRFNFPGGIAVDSAGVLYVADSYNHRLQRITADGGVSLIGGRGSARTQFLSPQAVAVDSSDSFYVVEQGNHRVQKYTAAGALDLVIDEPGHLAGQLYRPTGIAVTHSGDIYVADTGNCRVQRFDREGRYLNSIGSRSGQGVITTPQAVAVDRDEYVYVLDTFGHRVVRYDPNGRFAGQFGGGVLRNAAPNPASPRFHEPRAIVADPCGLVYVTDTGDTMADGTPSRGRLQVLDATTGRSELGIDRLGRNLGFLFRPGGLAITPPSVLDGKFGEELRGDIYVSDTMNHRILRFAWYIR